MELILKAKDIRVEFTGRDVLDIDEIEVYDYDRIGLVGANGAGKSTLFKVLLGELTPPGCKMNRLGELSFIPQLDEVSLREEKDFALVGKLGVEQLNIQTMSGGEETRLKIAQALSAQVHGILADEPTSHLDREGIDFLIGQLKYFTGALLVISHDRYGETILIIFVRKRKNARAKLHNTNNLLRNVPDWKGLRRKSESRPVN